VDQGVLVSCHNGQVKPGQPDWPGPVDLLVCGQPETDDGDGVGAGTRGCAGSTRSSRVSSLVAAPPFIGHQRFAGDEAERRRS
jgi:hypothetical protein